ncbi:hypothetical protein CVT26_006374 [Gymnopilus dilepis]|uniref:Uncharacterized protein n=1 Tax=Gymnopilus dilepis TaxID=231916 RepID=A0A409W6A1_9AGAR|nr:hypothetical protein CVT26_006374 [Gymnopilus dilepis]
MKSFFSRLHDTQTGHSKSASKETYKFWIPNSNAGRDSPKPNFVRENAAPVQSARPQAEKRSSSRAQKQSNPVPVSSQDKSAPPTNITSTAPITQHPTYAAATYTVPSSHHASTSAQPISNATTTRHHGYYNDKAQMLSPPAAYPSYSTKTWSQQQIPTKSAPQASTSHAVPAASQHELWAPTYLPSPSKQAEDPAKPLESAEPLVKHLVYTSEKERAPETGKRDRDRPKEKERDRRREKGVDREKGRHLVKEQISENPRERERTRPRERDKGAERDLKEREYREREREREADRRRDHDRDRQRERARERENEQKERDKEAELEKERDRRDREREQREREQRERDQRERDQREREYKEREQREREHKEREQREREREYKEREQREREQRERDQREREQRERDQREREQREREQREREYREREQREREQKQERDRREREREQREKEREQERDRERERERRERERARVYDREKREREKERERERYRTKDRDQVDHERGKVRADNAIKGSPTTKMKDRAVGEAISIPDDPQRVAQPEVIKAEPYSQSSNIRKERDVRTTRDHHRSKRRDAEQRYRAEATDGEQVSRRAKPRTSQADRLKEDRQGWVSDTFATDERKFYRPVIAREQPPIDEGENSDNSQARIGSRATQRQPRADVNDPISKDRLPQNSTTLSQVPEYMQSRVVHGVLESQPPVSATPLQMHVHLPPKDSRTADRPVQLLANDIAANDAVVPVRREINRLKLNSRLDELRPSFPEVLPRTVDVGVFDLPPIDSF